MARQQYRKNLIVPTGVLSYPWLTQGNPDVRFGAGKYKTNSVISGPEAEKFMADLEVIKAEALKHLQQDDASLTDLKLPVDPAKDDTGEVIPGSYVVKAKANAEFKNADGTTSPNELVIVDASKTRMQGPVNVWSGTKAKLAVQVGAINTSIYKGLVFRLTGVQIIDLVSSGGSDMFDKEDGFVAEPVAVAPTPKAEVTDNDEVHF